MKLLNRKFQIIKKSILSLPRPALLLIGLGIILILPLVINIVSQQINVNLTKNLPTTVTIPINSVDVLTCGSYNDTDITTCQSNQGCTWNASFRECSGNLIQPVSNPPGDPLPKSAYTSCEGVGNGPLVKLSFRAASNAERYRINIWKPGQTTNSFRNMDIVADPQETLTFTWSVEQPVGGSDVVVPQPNTTYNWGVAAWNTNGGFSNHIEGGPFTTSNCDSTGAGGVTNPQALSETHITCTNSYWKSQFNFTRGAVNGTPRDAYLDLKPDDGFGFGQGSFQGRGPIGADSYEWTDIKANTKYVWRVTMLRPDGGYAVSNEKKFTTPACTNTGGGNTGGGNTGGGGSGGGGNTGGGGTTNPPATPACLLNKSFPIPAKDPSKPPVVSIHLDIKLSTDTNYVYLDIAGPLSPDATSYTIRDLYPNTSYNVRTWMHTGNGEGYYAGLSSFTMGACPQATSTPVPNNGGGGNTGGGGSGGQQVSCDSECKKQVGTLYCSSGTAPVGGSCTCTLCSVLSPAAPTATKTPTPTATKTPTPVQSAPTATKTPTPIQGGQATATPIQSGPTSTPLPGQATATPIPSTNQAKIAVTLDIPGLGTNKALGQNPNPIRNTRTAQIKVFDANNTLVKEVSGQVSAQDLRNAAVITNISSVDFAYRGTFDLGTLSGNHTVKARFDNSLWKTIGIANFVNGQTATLPLSVLTTGDIDQNNELNLVDYNLIVSCYGTKSCSQKEKADLNIDGKVDELDLNILYASFAKRQGD